MNTTRRNDNMDDYDSLLKSMNGIVEQMKGLVNMAVGGFDPLQDDLWCREASPNERGRSFDYMFSFLGGERMC